MGRDRQRFVIDLAITEPTLPLATEAARGLAAELGCLGGLRVPKVPGGTAWLSQRFALGTYRLVVTPEPHVTARLGRDSPTARMCEGGAGVGASKGGMPMADVAIRLTSTDDLPKTGVPGLVFYLADLVRAGFAEPWAPAGELASATWYDSDHKDGCRAWTSRSMFTTCDGDGTDWRKGDVMTMARLTDRDAPYVRVRAMTAMTDDGRVVSTSRFFGEGWAVSVGHVLRDGAGRVIGVASDEEVQWNLWQYATIAGVLAHHVRLGMDERLTLVDQAFYTFGRFPGNERWKADVRRLVGALERYG